VVYCLVGEAVEMCIASLCRVKKALIFVTRSIFDVNILLRFNNNFIAYSICDLYGVEKSLEYSSS